MIINDVSSVLEHMKENRDFYLQQREPVQTIVSTPRKRSPRYDLFLNDTERDHYFSDVTLCRFLFFDIARKTNLEGLKRYLPKIAEIDYREIEKIYYESESEEFVIRTKNDELRIYRGDMRYIYPFYCQVRDPIEYELVFEDDKVYSIDKFNDSADAILEL